MTALERHEVEVIAQALTRQRLLDRLEERVLSAALQDPEPIEAEEDGAARPARGAKPLPSLDTLARYRRRLTLELKEAGGRLAGLKRARARTAANVADTERTEPVSTALEAALHDLESSRHGFGTVEQAISDEIAPALNRAQRRRLKAKHRRAA